MAFEHGSGAFLELDDSGGTARDVTAYVSNVSGFPETVTTHDTTNYGSAGAVERFAGLKDLTFTVNGIFDATVDGYLAGIIGYTGTYTFGPQGNTGGDVKYTGEAICQSYNVSAPVGDMVTWTASFERTGTGTRTTF